MTAPLLAAGVRVGRSSGTLPCTRTSRDSSSASAMKRSAPGVTDRRRKISWSSICSEPAVLPRAGADAAQDEPAAGRRQRERGRTRAIRDAHDDRAAAAVLEELLDGVAQRGRLPQPAEHARVVGEAAHRHGFVDGTLECAAYEGGDAGRGARDDAYRAGCIGCWILRVERLGQSAPLNAAR